MNKQEVMAKVALTEKDTGSPEVWMLPDSLPLRGFFMSRNPPNLFNKLGRIQSGCALFLCEAISQPVDDYLVEVITTEVSITIGRKYLEYAATELQDRDIECGVQ